MLLYIDNICQVQGTWHQTFVSENQKFMEHGVKHLCVKI
jgi:hypothetical protein